MSEAKSRISCAGKTGRPSRKRSLELTERILDVATAMFLEIGYEASSIDAIASIAGISKRTFYARFPSKAELFEAVVVRYINEKLSEYDREVQPSDDLRQGLTETATSLLKRALVPETIALDRVITGEAKKFPELARVLYDHGLLRAADRVRTVLEAGAARGEISRTHIDYLATAFLHCVFAPVLRLATLGLEPPAFTTKSSKQVADAVDLFLNGALVTRE
ncbi:transcriptional regulator, TetR family [Faunimonas pinastri]|uniref:Transcriptional regulator, TetR family n=1 Tax=Faunimonas pinastri TaxID=1855383 RepID=A0A1H9K8S8_9HYPH|nr:TetR/AcrR family transcriptional regulator [Faunimonas pinastri]SEQ95337.1 transcriptional regulator, TetR family [Faunimonas pinastri]